MNAENPYAAPKAVVADVDPASSPDRPAKVDQAIKFLWIGLLFGVASSIINLVTLDSPGMPKGVQVGVTVVSLLIGLALWVWLIHRAGRGRNWARIVVLVFVAFGVLSSATMFVSPVKIHWSVWVLFFVQTGLNVTAMFYLFSSSANDWYRALRR